MQTAEAEARVVGHVAAQMGRKHLDSPPTAVPNHLLTGLWVVMGLSPKAPVCSMCVCRKGLCQARRLQGGIKVCSDQVPLETSRTVKCVLGNRVMEFRKFPSLPNVPSFHPKAGWHPGIREGGLTVAILTPPGDRSSRTPS